MIVPGANGQYGIEDLEKSKDIFGSPGIFVSQLEMPIEVVMYAIKVAHKNSFINIFNPAPCNNQIPNEIFAYIDFLCLNESEAHTLSAIEVLDVNSAKKSCEILQLKGAKNIILTMGSNGVVFLDNQRNFEHFSSNKVINVVDSTGAGDSFIGAFSSFLSFGYNPKKAIFLANKIASISVQRKGAQNSYLSLSDLDSYKISI